MLSVQIQQLNLSLWQGEQGAGGEAVGRWAMLIMGGTNAYVGTGSIQEISIPSSQFCCQNCSRRIKQNNFFLKKKNLVEHQARNTQYGKTPRGGRIIITAQNSSFRKKPFRADCLKKTERKKLASNLPNLVTCEQKGTPTLKHTVKKQHESKRVYCKLYLE